MSSLPDPPPDEISLGRAAQTPSASERAARAAANAGRAAQAAVTAGRAAQETAKRERTAQEAAMRDRAARTPAAPSVERSRSRGLRPYAELPARTRLLVVILLLVDAGVAVYTSVVLVGTRTPVIGALLVVLTVAGAAVLGAAIITLTRLLYSLNQIPYLIGRGVRRALFGRRRG